MVRRRASAGGLSVLEGAAPPDLLRDGVAAGELLPEGAALAEPLADGAALAEPRADGAALAPGAAELSGALVQAASTRQSAAVTAAAPAPRRRRAGPSFAGVVVLSLVPLVLTCALTPPSAVLAPTVRGEAVPSWRKRRTLR
jgi:hypothetical protein